MTDVTSAPDRPRLLQALDRMIESVQEDIPRSTDDEDVAHLRGELKGLMAARAYAEGEAARSERRRTVAPHVDGQDFYELCQQYRHAREMMPHGMPNTVQAFNNIREYIKTGRLPWPSYENAAPQDATQHREPTIAGSLVDHAPAESAPGSATPNSGVVESLIGQLRKQISHTECEDPWYSCSQHDSCADDRRKGDPCDCGAQHLNEMHAHAADALERSYERERT